MIARYVEDGSLLREIDPSEGPRAMFVYFYFRRVNRV